MIKIGNQNLKDRSGLPVSEVVYSNLLLLPVAKIGNHMSYKESVKKRLESKIIKDPKTKCWNWTARKDKDGYPEIQIQFPVRGKFRATRIAYDIYKGEKIGKLLVCHKCDNPSCINPEHLFLGTHKDNIRDCVRKGRWNQKGSKNPGSKLTEQNVLMIRSMIKPDNMNKKQFYETIGKIYGVEIATISGIINKRSWKHV